MRVNQPKYNARRREQYRNSPELRRAAVASARAYNASNPMAKRASMYGLDRDVLERMLDRGCAICGAGAEWAGCVPVRLHIDHDHATGRVRGVLCEGCNHGLGKFYENPVTMASAINYLLGAR